MRIGVGPREEQKKKKEKKKNFKPRRQEKKKRRERKNEIKEGRNSRGALRIKSFLRSLPRFPRGTMGKAIEKAVWFSSWWMKRSRNGSRKFSISFPNVQGRWGVAERRKRRRRKKLDKNDRMWIIPPRLPTARGRRKRGEVEKEKEKEREREGGEETRNRKRRGEDVGEKWTMHVSQSGEEIRRRDPADA